MADDENLELKKRSRRRLVGAAALALLAAIVLPMIMDDEPGVPVQDIQLTIPDRNADSALARPIAGRPDADAVVAPPPQEQAPVSATGRPPTDQPGPGSASPVSQDDKAAIDKNQAVTSPVAPGAPPPSGQDEAARVQALLDGKAAPPEVSERPFVVQVGAFSEKAKAVAFSDDLKERGFSSYTENAGAVTRVRVGPYATRGDAEKAATRLEAMGIDGVITSR